MGIVITRYEYGPGIKFDVSKFDYGYDDDTFPVDAAIDFENIIYEHGDIYFTYNPSDTTDSMGHVTNSTNTENRVTGMFQDIGIKDRKIHEMGLAVPGNRKFYFMPSYTVLSAGVGTAYQLKEGDIIKDAKLYESGTSVGQWRVVKILKQWYEPNKETYRVAIVKNINLDGTE